VKESSALGSKLGLFSASDAKMNELFPDLLMRTLVDGMFGELAEGLSSKRFSFDLDYLLIWISILLMFPDDSFVFLFLGRGAACSSAWRSPRLLLISFENWY